MKTEEEQKGGFYMDVNFIGGMPEGYHDIEPQAAVAKAQAVMAAEQRTASAAEPTLKQKLAELEAAIQAAEAAASMPTLPVLREQRGKLATQIAAIQQAQKEEHERQRKAALASFAVNLKEAERIRHDMLVTWCECSLLLGKLVDVGEALYRDAAALRAYGPEDAVLRHRLDLALAPPNPRVEVPGLRVGTMNLGFNWRADVLPAWEEK